MPFDSAFIARWSAAPARERAHYQQFFVQLCDVLDVPQPDPSAETGPDYCFEKPVTLFHPDGRETTGRVDFYRKGCFVLEAKQASGVIETAAVQGLPGPGSTGVRRDTPAWAKAMRAAFTQARRYATNLPGRKPPFVITCDIGHVFEVWSDFTETGTYGGYGARRTIPFGDLAKPEVRAFFQAVFLDPAAVDPARHSARVTREVAGHLADLARSLEKAGHAPSAVSRFLMACLFTMFAEDVGLLPGDLFSEALEKNWLDRPERFQTGIALLWNAMDKGLPFGFEPKILRFNGGLFASPTILPLTADQLRALLAAAKCDWSAVEPAIFGTLLERALNPVERAALGAHFTPRAYIERLVRPTIIEPLQAEWALVQAQVRLALDAAAETSDARARRDRQEEARSLLLAFLHKLCQLRVLDPACGTGNFLYVSFILLKGLEEEIRRELEDLGTSLLELRGVTVNPSQFLGIERNVRAREIADLVLWIGYLQWYRTARRGMAVEEPVLRTYENIVARDAVLTWSRERLKVDETGKPVRVWDMRTTRPHPVTGEPVPDTEKGMVTISEYDNPAPADWPDADFIVGNPPFVGNKLMRQALGDGYTETLRATWPDVPQTADLVMYWWEKAATMTRAGRCRRFGLITTNSLTQVFNRKVLERHLGAKDNPLVVAWAIPDHPWVDAGADVRIAMTVGVRADAIEGKPVLGETIWESPERGDEGAARDVDVSYGVVDRIHADLSGGADVVNARPLRANDGVAGFGFLLGSRGFVLTAQQAESLADPDGGATSVLVKPLLNGNDVNKNSRHLFAIDAYGWSEDELRSKAPRVYQHMLLNVKPDRDQNRDPRLRRCWWLHRRTNEAVRAAIKDLPWFFVTSETSRHRFFIRCLPDTLPEHKLVVIALSDWFYHGCLHSRTHLLWALAAGGRLGVGNDPVYSKTLCFDAFPFPDVSGGEAAHIRRLAELMENHRHRAQTTQPFATLSAQYAALDRWREVLAGGRPLDDEERAFQDRVGTGVLASLHDDLDAAVVAAYGWPAELSDDEILVRLVALNRERAAEEAKGVVRWLRPSFQAPAAVAPVGMQMDLAGMETGSGEHAAEEAKGPQPWPKEVASQIKAVRDYIFSCPGGASLDETARSFKGARRDAVRRQLEVIESLGLIAMFTDNAGSKKWIQQGTK